METGTESTQGQREGGGGAGGGRLRALSEFALEKGTQKFSLFFLLFPLSSSYHLPPHFKNKIYPQNQKKNPPPCPEESNHGEISSLPGSGMYVISQYKQESDM